MNEVQREAIELLGMMPKVNSATPYGSGYFKQDSVDDDKKAMDIILSVDNPNEWHIENYELNPWIYSSANKRNLMFSHEVDGISFPNSLGCFFTNYEGREYKFLVVNKKLLYSHLTSWERFSLAGRFQKEMFLLIDNSDGVLPELMNINYRNAVKTALLLHPERAISEQTLYETIVSLSYLGDLRMIFHMENPNKIPNIVAGSYDFLRDTYGNFDSEYFYEDGLIYKNRGYYRDALGKKIESLPSSLRNYLFKKLSYSKDYDYEEIAGTIKSYFKILDLLDSFDLLLRCYKTVGIQNSMKTLTRKFEKGMQKVKR